MKSILLIDGNNLMYRGLGRAHMTHNGKRTEGIFMGLSMLKNLLVQFEPALVFVVWDGGCDPERRAKYPDYKKRKIKKTKAEEVEMKEFYRQVPKFVDALSKLGIMQVKIKNREADDIIYSLIDGLEMFSLPDVKTIIVSTDKDFFQLLKKTNVYNPVKGEMMTEELYEKTYGFPVEFSLMYKAMSGDRSDNLPGVFGVGAVGATMYIKTLLKTENEKMGLKEKTKLQKIVDKVDKNFEVFELMFELMKFKRIDLTEIVSNLIHPQPQALSELQDNGMKLISDYGFNSLLEQFGSFLIPFELLFMKPGNDIGKKP